MIYHAKVISIIMIHTVILFVFCQVFFGLVKIHYRCLYLSLSLRKNLSLSVTECHLATFRCVLNVINATLWPMLYAPLSRVFSCAK